MAEMVVAERRREIERANRRAHITAGVRRVRRRRRGGSDVA
jgi:hypothetical protein